MLHRWGFTYTRPTYRLKKAIPLNRKVPTGTRLIKNLSDDMILFYEDETHIRDYQALHTLFFGENKNKFTYGRHASVTLFGAVNTQNGRLHCMEASSCNAPISALLQYT